MDYISMCKSFFAATNIPISLLKNNHPVYSALGEVLSINPVTHWHIFPPHRNPSFQAFSPDIEYGLVQIEGTGYDLILGPAFNVPVTEQIVRQFMRELVIPLDYREILTNCLYAIPRISHLQFVRYLAFFHQCLNHKEADLQDFYNEDEIYARSRSERKLDSMMEDMENENLHNSYDFELKMYHYIKEGDTAGLTKLLTSSKLILKEGKMAHTPLRHTKNIFINVVTKTGMLGAIPGGLNIEKVYQLIDLYIQECEQLQTIEEITSLQYVMLLDFCKRVNEAHMPDGISSEVYQCMNFIRTHTNEPITVHDAAKHVHRSSSYMMKRFKEDLGIHIGAFITRCKLEEAKSLLVYSQKSLSEISSYLCFSSQSYFQTVFKKQYGLTPMQYRKKFSQIH